MTVRSVFVFIYLGRVLNRRKICWKHLRQRDIEGASRKAYTAHVPNKIIVKVIRIQ